MGLIIITVLQEPIYIIISMQKLKLWLAATRKRQEQPNVEVSEVYFHVYGYILVFLEPK